MDLSPADGTGARRAGLLVTFAGSSARALDRLTRLTVWLPAVRETKGTGQMVKCLADF
jgi:hypothetical protein